MRQLDEELAQRADVDRVANLEGGRDDQVASLQVTRDFVEVGIAARRSAEPQHERQTDDRRLGQQFGDVALGTGLGLAIPIHRRGRIVLVINVSRAVEDGVG